MSVLDDLAVYLAAHGLSVQLTKGLLPDSPDDAAALHEYGGQPSVYTHDLLGAAIERPRVSFVARSKPYDYQSARSYVQQARAILDGLGHGGSVALSGNTYQRIVALQSPMELGRDERSRVQVAINFEVWRTPTPS